MVRSNRGLVTAAAVKLMPRPESTRFIRASFDDAALPAVIESLRRLSPGRYLPDDAHSA